MTGTNKGENATYDVVLTGNLLPGFAKERAALSLAQFLNASAAQASALLQGRSKVIKKNVNKDQAMKYKVLLASHGIAAQVKQVGGSVGADKPGSSKNTKAKETSPKKQSGTEARQTETRRTATRVSAQAKTQAAKVTHISEAAKLKNKKSNVDIHIDSNKERTVAGTQKKTTQKASTVKKKVSPVAPPAYDQGKAPDSNIFNGLLQCKPVTMLQQLALMASCSVLVVLTVFYAGIFVSSAFFAIERLVSFLFFNDASSIFTAIFIYILPCLFALLFCVLMLRPVLSKRMKTERLELDAKNERNLLNFVKQIAALVGSPKPEEVIITDEFDAVAEFEPGWQSLKEGRIQLRIGLPLLMVMDIPSLAGIISSTLARFDDKTGMYMLKVIRELNQRLENAYHNRDNWQDVLEKISQSKYAIISKFLSRLYQPILSLSSWFAFPFLMLVRVVSAATSRSQSYRSDNYFNALAGTRKFVGHFTFIYASRYAYSEAEESLRAGVESHKFVNDLPALLLHAYKNLSSKVNAEVRDAIVEHSTCWDDLQPCNRDRMIAAEEDDYEGIVELKAEAWRLLQDLKGASRRYTLAYYKLHDYGVDEKLLVDARELATTSNEDRVRDEICHQYFNGWFEPELFWQTNQFAYARSISKQQRIVEINECVKILRRSSPDFMALKSEVTDRFTKYSFSRFAVEINKAGYRLDADIPYFDDVAVSNLGDIYNSRRREYESRRAQQRDLCRVMGERLCFALAFLSDPREIKIAEVVLSILSVLEAQANQLDALRHAVFLVPHFRERIKKKDETEHSRRLRRLSREILTAYELCLAEFKRYRWPFGSQYKTVADYVVRSLPPIEDESAVNKEGKPKSASAILDSRIVLYESLWNAVTQANRFLNGKIAPLAQKAELENSIARIKMTVSGKQTG